MDAVIPEIILQHLEESAFLWGQRHAALRSPDYTLADVRELEQRIDAHLDGLVIAGEHAVPMLEAGLSSEDPHIACAAARGLLLMHSDSATATVLAAFLSAEGPALDGIRDALCHHPIGAIANALREAFVSDNTPVAVAAGEVLAVHARLDPATGRLAELLADTNPAVRRAAWRIAAILDSTAGARR